MSATVVDACWVSWADIRELGVTFRQYDWWCSNGWLQGLASNPGTGIRRRFPATEMSVAAALRDYSSTGHRGGPGTAGLFAEISAAVRDAPPHHTVIVLIDRRARSQESFTTTGTAAPALIIPIRRSL